MSEHTVANAPRPRKNANLRDDDGDTKRKEQGMRQVIPQPCAFIYYPRCQLAQQAECFCYKRLFLDFDWSGRPKPGRGSRKRHSHR